MSDMIPLADLWARDSAKGNRYLSGRLGKSRLLILERRAEEGDGENPPTHTAFLVPADKPAQGAQGSPPDGTGARGYGGQRREASTRPSAAARQAAADFQAPGATDRRRAGGEAGR